MLYAKIASVEKSRSLPDQYGSVVPPIALSWLLAAMVVSGLLARISSSIGECIGTMVRLDVAPALSRAKRELIKSCGSSSTSSTTFALGRMGDALYKGGEGIGNSGCGRLGKGGTSSGDVFTRGGGGP